MKKRLNIAIGGGNALIISTLQNPFVCIRTRLQGAYCVLAGFFCALTAATFVSCGDYEEPSPKNPEIEIKADDAWQGQRVYDLDGNLLYTVTASGDTIWNDGKEGGDGR